MAQHPADPPTATNPRIQCVVCGKWKRLHGRDTRGQAIQRFYGGCDHNNGGDHLAHKGSDYDVCADCCASACRRLAAFHCVRGDGCYCDAERRERCGNWRPG